MILNFDSQVVWLITSFVGSHSSTYRFKSGRNLAFFPAKNEWTRTFLGSKKRQSKPQSVLNPSRIQHLHSSVV